jgi:hypothetical protein
MRGLMSPKKLTILRLATFLVAVALLPGCNIFRTKSKITVPQLLTPLDEADTAQLIGEINRHSAVRSLSGKIDITFLDTSFAECGVADLYRTADGRVIVQRPGNIYLLVQAPLGIKIAEMSSTGEQFWAALYQGDERFRRFVTGRNRAEYEKLATNGNGSTPDCRKDGKKQEAAMQRATVSALSSLRPQHFADALLVPTASTDGGIYYTKNEAFEEENDPREGAKKGARVVRGYYILSEVKPIGEGRAEVLRRFWFDRVGAIRLARVQTYNEKGQLLTDVVYGEPKVFGQSGGQRLPAMVVLTRPHERYSIRIGFEDPSEVKLNQAYNRETFVLQNESKLPEVDLDAKKKEP